MWSTALISTSFNPLPSPKQGETSGSFLHRCAVAVSIRSPHRSKGRRPRTSGSIAKKAVSIRSPHRSKGRRGTDRRNRFLRVFQSAPLTEARGDHAAALSPPNQPRFNPLPSPKQGETAAFLRDARPYQKFQSAPLTEARGDSPAGAAISTTASFNPLPSPKQGETATRFCIAPPTKTFQSAPLTEARGDGIIIARDAEPDTFQSAPLTEARGDSCQGKKGRFLRRFQSAPLTEARGDPIRAS